jgi:hypothetical protein
MLLATFALHKSDDAMTQQLKAHLRRLGLELGLLANFYGTKLVITPVRVKQEHNGGFRINQTEVDKENPL